MKIGRGRTTCSESSAVNYRNVVKVESGKRIYSEGSEMKGKNSQSSDVKDGSSLS